MESVEMVSMSRARGDRSFFRSVGWPMYARRWLPKTRSATTSGTRSSRSSRLNHPASTVDRLASVTGAALAGILFILRHDLRWRDLPQERGYGSGVTCWRRLRQWQQLGIWSGVHQVVL